MNEVQFLRQAKYLLKAATWPDGAAQRVWPPESVRVTAGPIEPLESDVRFPLCLLSGSNERADEADPDLVALTLSATLVAQAEGGDFAERAVLGSPRAAGQGKSIGRGVLDLAERARDALGRLTGANGCPAVLVHDGDVEAEQAGSVYLVAKRLSFRALGTIQPLYDAHRFLAAQALGGGVVRLTWRLAPTRFDMFDGAGVRLKPVIRYAAGATAPTSPTAGTGVTIATATAETVDATVGAGQKSFALFAAYTESGHVLAEKYSPQDLVNLPDTVATVVVT